MSLCCPLCENGSDKCECPPHLFHSLKNKALKDTPVRFHGYYMWEDWEGNKHEEKLDAGITILIDENTTPEKVAEILRERLKNA